MKKYHITFLLAVFFMFINAFSLEKPEKRMFSLSITDETSFFNYYYNIFNEQENILLTKDFMFHAEHLLLDYSLAYSEEKYLYNMLDSLLDIMIEQTRTSLSQVKSGNLNESYQIALAYLSVSKKCLFEDYSPDISIKERVISELQLIERAEGFTESNIFHKKEDYSQYKPRGHYTRSEMLKRYFKSMMYLMRMRFSIELRNEKDPQTELRAALIVGNSLRNSKTAMNLYKKMNEVISVLLPQEDDLRITELYDSIGGTFSNFELSDEKKMNFARDMAVKLSDSKIISDYKEDNEDKVIVIGFMAQRYIFDSEVFQNLVYDKVTYYKGKGNPFTLHSGVRAMPRGLDLMYVLGSGIAFQILSDEGDVQYKQYLENASKMIDEGKNLKKNSFYNRMLFQYQTVINEKKESSPSFMLSENYQYKELSTVLASWTSLRHDVILYAKQSYTVKVTSVLPKQKEMTRIISEPYRNLYASMNIDVQFLMDKLFDLLNDSLFLRIKDNFASLCLIYENVSSETFKGDYYTDIQSVKNAFRTMDNTLKLLLGRMKEKDDNIMIVSDVHTDSNSENVLQEAIGPILTMTVQYNGFEFAGGAMSYFEFKKPMSERMTDEEWRELAKKNDLRQFLFKWQKRIYD